MIYGKAGTNIASCVVDTKKIGDLMVDQFRVRSFWADTTTYYLSSESSDEAHFLCAFLNSTYVNEAIKPYQTKGAWGERDIHRRPFEVVSIPKFDPNDSKHIMLARLSRECHQKVTRLKLRNKSIGLLRNKVRQHLLSELVEIDKVVKDILSQSRPE